MRYSRSMLITLLTLFASYQVFSQTNFWEQTDGPYGGQIQSLLMTPDGFLYAGTSLGKFFRSTNDGNAWTETSTFWKNTYVTSMALGLNGLFAGTAGSGLFLSMGITGVISSV